MENRLLIVDDDKELPLVLSDFFIRKGYRVHTAFSGEEAMNSIQNQVFDLILLDVEMPGLSGLDVLQNVKQERRGTKVIIITGHKEYEDQARSLRCDEFMRKPFSLDSLTVLMEKLLKKKHGEEKKVISLAQKFNDAAEGSPMADIMLIEPIEPIALELTRFLEDERRAKGYFKVHHVLSKGQAVAMQQILSPSLTLLDLRTVSDASDIVSSLQKSPTPPKDFIFYFDPAIPSQEALPGKRWEGHPMKSSDLDELSVLIRAVAFEYGLLK